MRTFVLSGVSNGWGREPSKLKMMLRTRLGLAPTSTILVLPTKTGRSHGDARPVSLRACPTSSKAHLSTSKQLRITFDTNTAAKLVTAYRARRDGNWAKYGDLPEGVILTAIEDGRVVPFATNVSLDLEGIPKAERKAYFSAFGFTSSEEISTSPNQYVFNLKAGSTHEVRIHEIQENRYTDFVNLGGKFLNHSRIGQERLSPIVHENLADDVLFAVKERLDRTSMISREIEGWGCGIAWIKAIGHELDPAVPWFKALGRAAVDFDDRVANAISEWADGDAVSAHYGYGNDVFCTNDRASGAGAASVFSAANRKRLSQDYSVALCDLTEVQAMLAT